MFLTCFIIGFYTLKLMINDSFMGYMINDLLMKLLLLCTEVHILSERYKTI